jgi:sulfite exporter TauE/SafE
LLGAAAGLLGAAVDLAGSMAGVQRVAALAAGVLIVLWGGYSLAQALDLPLPAPPAPRFLRSATARVWGSLARRSPVTRALLLGLFSTLLPCGWLYAFAVLAAGTGSVWAGMLVMAAFWAGTVPVMLGLGLSLQALSVPLRRKVPVATAAMLVVVGLLWLFGRAGMPSGGGHAHHGVVDVAPVGSVGDDAGPAANESPHDGH